MITDDSTRRAPALLASFPDGQARLNWLTRGGSPSSVAGLDLRRHNSPGNGRLNLALGAATLRDRRA
jgi:hypothetical protein